MLRIFLYSAIVIGCFANFARNDWGFNLRGYAELLLGFTFVADFIFHVRKKNLNLTKGNRVLTQAERIFIFMFFLGCFFRSVHWPGAGLILVFSSGLIILSAFARFFGSFFNNKLHFTGSFLLKIFFVAVLIETAGIIFKMMHWPFGSVLIMSGLVLFFMVVVSLITVRHLKFDSLSLSNYILEKYSVARFVFFYFGFWAVYINLAQNQLAPRFYSSENPYVFEKLLEENNPDEAQKIEAAYSDLVDAIHSI